MEPTNETLPSHPVRTLNLHTLETFSTQRTVLDELAELSLCTKQEGGNLIQENFTNLMMYKQVGTEYIRKAASSTNNCQSELQFDSFTLQFHILHLPQNTIYLCFIMSIIFSSLFTNSLRMDCIQDILHFLLSQCQTTTVTTRCLRTNVFL